MPALVTDNVVSGVSVPVFELDFKGLKLRMEQFQSRFDQTLQEQRSQIAHTRQEFSRLVSENNETERLLKAEIESLTRKSDALTHKHTEEMAELEATRRTIGELKAKKEQLVNQQRQYKTQIENLQQKISQLSESMTLFQKNVSNQSGQNGAELQYWQQLLGLRIDGLREDYLKLVFTNVDAAASEYSFVLDMTGDDYKVKECKPPVEESVLSRIVQQFNTKRELSLFLRDMRRALKN